MRKRISVLVAAFLAVTAGMTVLASSASAHDAQIGVGVVCDNGDYQVTWTVKNWSGGGTGTILESSRSVVPTGTTFNDGQTKTFTETVPAPATLTLTLKTKWSADGYVATNARTLQSSEFPATCTKPDVPVTPEAPSVTAPTCSVDGSLVVPADTDKVTYGQSPAGSGPGTYTVTATAKPGYKIDGTASWTLTVEPKKTGEECLTPVTSAPATVSAPTCDLTGALQIPADTESVAYSQDPAGSAPGTYTVTATAKPGYKLEGTTSWVLTVLPKLTEGCAQAVTPVAPSVTTITACGTYGAIQYATTPGVTYTLTEGDGKSGVYTVTATANEGYVIADGAPTQFGGNLGTFTECEPPVVEPPTTEPPVTQPPGSTVTPPASAAAPPGDTVLPDTGAGDLLPVGLLGLLVVGLGAVLVRRSART